mmetsp:Transcript_12184/g.23590  ORF Transcript_12184/g.23590 Transcript_12184/m.23590 type:complete len:96 (-) Transcript_12184:601-888(-)
MYALAALWVRALQHPVEVRVPVWARTCMQKSLRPPLVLPLPSVAEGRKRGEGRDERMPAGGQGTGPVVVAVVTAAAWRRSEAASRGFWGLRELLS